MGPKRSVSQFASKSSILSQSGQGTIEYILLLVVSIGIVSLLAAKYFKPIGDFAANYFGEYTQCLLETGELPSIGVEGAEGQCNSEFEPFTVAAGRPSKSGGGGSGNGSGGNGNSGNGSGSESGSGSQSGEGNGSGREGEGDSAGEGAGDQADSAGGRGRGRRGTPAISESSSSFGSGSSRDGGGGGEEKISANESLLADGNKNDSSSSYGGGVGRRDNYRGIAGRIPIEQEKKKAEAPSKVVASKSESQQVENSDPGKIKAAERNLAQNKIEEEEGIGFGKWLRILFIVLIIVAIVVFFGLQAVQIAKGWE